MASSSRLQAAYFLVLSLNLIFFTLVTSTNVQCPPPPGGPPRGKCPRDALKLGVCADLLKGLLGLVLGTPPRTPCCSVIQGLADLEAAVCLCTAIKASVFGIVNLDLPLSLTLLVNYCGKNVPPNFECA